MLSGFEDFLVASGVAGSTAKDYRNAALQVCKRAEEQGLRVEGSVGAATLMELTSAFPGWSERHHAAAGWLKEYFRAKEFPQRYAEEKELGERLDLWISSLNLKHAAKTKRRSAVRQLLQLLREKGADVPKSVEDVEKLQLDWKRAGLDYHRGLGPLVDFFQQASAPSGDLSKARKRPRRVEEKGPTRAGGMSAACMGPVPTEAEAMKALGPKLQGSYKDSFFLGEKGRHMLVPIEEQHDTLALGLSSMEREGGDAVQNGLVGFESCRMACGEPINVALYGFGDGLFRSSMYVGYLAVRLRARAICRMLGVEDVDEAAKRVCDELCVSQLVMVAQPRGLNKKGGSAGLAAALSVVAMMTGRRLKRLVASTGQMTLGGQVLGIGGLEDKLQAARHHGIRAVILPLADLQSYRSSKSEAGSASEVQAEGPELVGVERLEDAIRIAFEDVVQEQAGGADDAEEDDMMVEETVEEAEKEAGGSTSSKLDHQSKRPDGAASSSEVSCSRLLMDEGLYWGAAQSVTWQFANGKVVPLAVEVEVVLQPGASRVTPLDHMYDSGAADVVTAFGWLSKYQHAITPREGGGFLLPDFAAQLVKLNVTTKVNPAGELRETYLGAAVAVGFVSAVTGYRYNKKACIMGAMTVDGLLLPMVSVTKIDLVIMLGGGVEVIVVAQESIEEVEALRTKYRSIMPYASSRFVGVTTLLEALPLLLLDYPKPTSHQRAGAIKRDLAVVLEYPVQQPAEKRPKKELQAWPV